MLHRGKVGTLSVRIDGLLPLSRLRPSPFKSNGLVPISNDVGIKSSSGLESGSSRQHTRESSIEHLPRQLKQTSR